MEWNRFDICEAYFVYAMLWHGGQWSKTYEIFGRLERMRFRPSPMLNNEKDLTDNGRIIYDKLVEKNYGKENTLPRQ